MVKFSDVEKKVFLVILFLGLLAIVFIAGCTQQPEEDIEEEFMKNMCEGAGGVVETELCCQSVNNYPNTCLIGACGCPPQGSHEVFVCDCGEGRCWNGEDCVSVEMPQEQTECTAVMSLSAEGSGECTVKATLEDAICLGTDYSIVSGNETVCEGIFTSTDSECEWDVKTGTYSYDLYINGKLQSSQGIECKKGLRTYNVSIRNFIYTPTLLTINAGETVIWKNWDVVEHTVTSDTGSELDSPVLTEGDTYSHTFNTPGTYPYHCTPNPWMIGKVTVK